MSKMRSITLEPGESLVVNGWYHGSASTSLFLVKWDISEGWAMSTCNELSDDSGLNCLVNNWELPPETSQEQL